MYWVFAMLLSVTLSPPFGEAEASTVRAGSDLELQVTVEVNAGALTVLARPVAAGGTELPPTALVNTGSNMWRGLVTVPARSDIRLGFELIAEAGSAATVSEVHTLIELGVDPAVFRDEEPGAATTIVAEDSRFSNETNQWGWLGLAAGAGALALLAFWVVGVRRTTPSGSPARSPSGSPSDSSGDASGASVDRLSGKTDNPDDVAADLTEPS